MADKPTTPKPRRYVLANTPEGGFKEFAGLGTPGKPTKVTNASLQNPNMIAALQALERRKGIRILGVDIVLE